MAVYAFDPERSLISVAWPTRSGYRCADVTPIAAHTPGTLMPLCATLTRLSQVMWDTYERPPAQAANDADRAWREREHADLASVLDRLTAPDRPDPESVLPGARLVLSAAAAAGRALHRIGDVDMAAAVILEVLAERDGVLSADRGELSGRAAQATALTRTTVSPVMLAAADELLRAEPAGVHLMSAAIEPASASAAAAHWLAAAAVVVAEVCGVEPDEAFALCGDPGSADVEVPSLVVSQVVGAGLAPPVVVSGMLKVAAAAARGIVYDLPGVIATARLGEQAIGRRPGGMVGLASGPVVLTGLDPRRAGPDLLERLLTGISMCQEAYFDAQPGTDGEFADLVRAEATRERQRIT